MLNQSSLAPYQKAIAAGLAGLVIAEAAKYGVNLPSEAVNNLAGVLVTGVLGYVVAHVTVWRAPANKVQ